MNKTALAVSVLLLLSMVSAFGVEIVPLNEYIIKGAQNNYTVNVYCGTPTEEFKSGDMMHLRVDVSYGNVTEHIETKQFLFEDGCSKFTRVSVPVPIDVENVTLNVSWKRMEIPIYEHSTLKSFIYVEPSDGSMENMAIQRGIQDYQFQIFSFLTLGGILLFVAFILFIFGKRWVALFISIIGLVMVAYEIWRFIGGS